jgi:hypothetical protein
MSLSSELDGTEFDEYWRLRESTLSTLTWLSLKIDLADFFENLLIIYTTTSRHTQEQLPTWERAVSWEILKYLMKQTTTVNHSFIYSFLH